MAGKRVFGALLEDLKRRDRLGHLTYHKELLYTDARDWEEEMYMELLDALVYLKAQQMRREAKKRRRNGRCISIHRGAR